MVKSPDITMELLYQTLYKLRTEYHFQGYIHVKAIPGASPELIEKRGISGRSYECESGAAHGGGAESTGTSEERGKSMLAPIRQVQTMRKTVISMNCVIPACTEVCSGGTVHADDHGSNAWKVIIRS